MHMVVLGAVFVDIKGYPLSPYLPGGRNEGTIRQVHGGVGRNIAENIARLGQPVRFVSLVDGTALGNDVVERLRLSGVDTRFIQRRPNGMGCYLAVLDGRGNVAAAISQRPDLAPLADLLDEKSDAIFSDAGSILIELDLDEPVLQRVFQAAKRFHLPVFAAVSNIRIAAKRRRYLPWVDCLVCNREEAGILFEEDFSSQSPDAIQSFLVRRIATNRIPSMVVTLGSEGAVYADLRGGGGFCPAEKSAVWDTVGAGDAFFSGCAAALSQKKPLDEACRAGARLAAQVVATTENVCPPSRSEEGE